MTNAAPVTVYVNNIKYIGNADVPWDSNNSYFSSKLTYIDGKVYYEDKPLYKDGVAVLSTDYPDEAYYDTIGDLTGYTWVGNSSLSNIAPSGTDITSKDGMAENYAINFTCNNVSYTYFNVLDRDYSPYGYFYSNEALNSDDGTTVVYTESWISDNFKTIQIIGGTDATNSNLIAWLENNGTLTAPVVQSTGKIVVGTKQVKKVYIGTKKVKKVYIGTKLSYEDNN